MQEREASKKSIDKGTSQDAFADLEVLRADGQKVADLKELVRFAVTPEKRAEAETAVANAQREELLRFAVNPEKRAEIIAAIANSGFESKKNG